MFRLIRSLHLDLLFGVAGEPPARSKATMGKEGAHAMLRFPFRGEDVDLVACFLEDVEAVHLDLPNRIAEGRQTKT